MGKGRKRWDAEIRWWLNLETLKITVNGQELTYKEQNLQDLLVSIGIDPKREGIAVALNYEVITSDKWMITEVKPNDKVEVIHAMAGG